MKSDNRRHVCAVDAFAPRLVWHSVIVLALLEGLTCAGQFPAQPQLYFSTEGNGGLYQLPALQPNTTRTTLLSGRRYAGLDYYSSSEEGYLVVGDNSGRDIVRVDAQNSSLTCRLVATRSAGATINGVSVDWLSKNVYWISEANKRIEMVRLDGSLRTVVLAEQDGVTVPSALAVWPQRGLLFWADLSRDVIERMALDGSQHRTIRTQVKSVRALTIDDSLGKLYWADTHTDAIFVVNPDGTDNTRLITSVNNVYAIGLFRQRTLFWVTQSGSMEEASALLSDYPTSKSRTSAPDHQLLHTFTQRPFGLVVVDGNRTGTNPCSVDNGGCQHLCLAYPHPLEDGKVLRRCVCSDSASAKTLCPTNTTHPVPSNCLEAALPSSYFVFTTSAAVRRFSAIDFSSVKWLDNPSVNNIATVLVNTTAQLVWVNSKTNIFYRTPLDRTSWLVSHRELFRMSGAIGCIATDSISQTVFITQINGSLLRFALNGSSTNETVAQGNASVYPYAVAVDSEARTLIWITRGNVTLVTSNLDGSAQVFLVRGASGQPEDIAVTGGTIYWSDSQRNVIEQISRDGTHRTVFLRLDSSFEKAPVGVATDGAHVYWTSFSLNHSACTLQRIKTNLSSDVELLDSWYGSQAGALEFVRVQNQTSPTRPTVLTTVNQTSSLATASSAMAATSPASTSFTTGMVSTVASSSSAKPSASNSSTTSTLIMATSLSPVTTVNQTSSAAASSSAATSSSAVAATSPASTSSTTGMVSTVVSSSSAKPSASDLSTTSTLIMATSLSSVTTVNQTSSAATSSSAVAANSPSSTSSTTGLVSTPVSSSSKASVSNSSPISTLTTVMSTSSNMMTSGLTPSVLTRPSTSSMTSTSHSITSPTLVQTSSSMLASSLVTTSRSTTSWSLSTTRASAVSTNAPAASSSSNMPSSLFSSPSSASSPSPLSSSSSSLSSSSPRLSPSFQTSVLVSEHPNSSQTRAVGNEMNSKKSSSDDWNVNRLAMTVMVISSIIITLLLAALCFKGKRRRLLVSPAGFRNPVHDSMQSESLSIRNNDQGRRASEADHPKGDEERSTLV